MKLIPPILLKRLIVFPILLFSSMSLHCSCKKAFLSLLHVLWNSALSWIYFSFSPLPLAYRLFSAICRDSSDNHFAFLHFFFGGWFWSPLAQRVKHLPAVRETRVRSLDQEDPPKKEMATHSNILVQEIPWTAEEPGGLQSMWSQELDMT